MRVPLLAKLAIVPLAGLAMLALVSTRSLTAPVLTTVEMKDLTWVDIRDAVKTGTSTAIVPTGGIEQNGPHMVLAKHDYIVGHAARRIAAELGKTLVAPVVPYVPEGDHAKPDGNLLFPGTLGISEAAFDGVLDGIARSLKMAGFKLICFIGDHGQSQDVQKAVAERLTRAWAKEGVRVAHIEAYYDDRAQMARMQAEGETEATIGTHAGLLDTSELLAIHPAAVDMTRVATKVAGARHPGSTGRPDRATPERGRALIEMRIKAAVQAIQALRGPRA